MRPVLLIKDKARRFCSFPIRGLMLLILLAIPIFAFSEDEITKILRDRIVQKQGVGIVVGVVDENGTKVIHYGKMRLPKGKPVDGRTIFEIGSITKVFTSLLLAQAVERGEIKLDDPVQKYLPPDVKMPTRNGREITFLDLATHRSGLPRVPDNQNFDDVNNPYADYTLQEMYDFLSGYNLTRDIGSEFEYSNFGVALLGQVLVKQTGKDYQSLIRQNICEPLNMTDTWICPVPENLATRMAPGYDHQINTIGNFVQDIYAPTGGICTDVEDLLKFLKANMNESGPLGSAMKMTHQVYAFWDIPTRKIGLAWHIVKRHPPTIIYHGGLTGGYCSFIGFEPERRRGVVVLSNTAIYVTDLGLHLLNPKYEL